MLISLVGFLCCFIWRWLLMMTCLWYVRKMHICSQNWSYETNQIALDQDERFFWQSLGLKDNNSIRSDYVRHSLNSPVMINLGLCKVEIVLVVEKNLQFTYSVSDGLCGFCDPVSRKAVGSATPAPWRFGNDFLQDPPTWLKNATSYWGKHYWWSVNR